MTTIDIDKFKSVLMIGETSSVEFKRCGGEIEHDVFESICAFLNRFGGDVYLGVLNDGTVEGVNAATAAEKMKNIINVVGNPNVFKPSPFEKPSIESGKPHIDAAPEDEKLHIGSGKLHIEQEKLHIGSEKLHIEDTLTKLDLSRPTHENIIRLYHKFGVKDIFGRTEICAVIEISERMASYLISQMMSYRLIESVTGQGKGKYRFRDFANPVNPVDPV